MKEQGYSMLSLSLAASLNETAIRDILNGKIKSPTYQTLSKISQALKCHVDDLMKEANPNSLEVIGRNLLFNNSKIDAKRFAKTITIVDELIKKKDLRLDPLVRTKIYFSWYDLSILNKDISKDKSLTEMTLDTIIKASSKY